jgi:putative DNA primase/helicase
MAQFLDANDISIQAQGRWISILSLLAGTELDRAVDNFDGTISDKSRYYCPIHGGKSGTAFTLYKDADHSGGGVCNSCGPQTNGFSLLMWIKDWNFRKCLEEVANALNIESSGNAPKRSLREVYKPKPLTEKELANDRKLIQKRDRIIAECLTLNTSNALPAKRYFARRGLTDIGLLGREVLFHPKLASWVLKSTNGKATYQKEGEFPCIVSIIRNNKGEVMNIHRTFITEDGFKAKIESPRKIGTAILSNPISGSGIHISPASKYMGVAEGLETTLAAKKVYSQLPTHCLINATLMKNWQPPSGVEGVIIFADLDKSQTGECAAQHLYDRLEKMGITVYIALPEEEEHLINIDWADVLELYGAEGFPELPFNVT